MRAVSRSGMDSSRPKPSPPSVRSSSPSQRPSRNWRPRRRAQGLEEGRVDRTKSRSNQSRGRRSWMGFMAERAAGRMQARQTYRTMSRMQRRRSYVEDKLGVREDFSSPQDQPAAQAAEAAPAPVASQPDYVSELERLAQLRDQGIITDDEFEAKKKQLLGI